MAQVLAVKTGASEANALACGEENSDRSEGNLEDAGLGHAPFVESSGEEDLYHRKEYEAPKPSCPGTSVLTTSMANYEQAPATELGNDTVKPASYDANKETDAAKWLSTAGKGAASTLGKPLGAPAIQADLPSTAVAAAPAPLAAPPKPRRRCVLVAKCLTNSDASSGRIILPRMAVETNLPFVTAYRHYALPVRDAAGRRYEFVVKSWANGTEHRRVFVLEQATEFLRAHGVGVGDTVGICSDESGELVVEANSEEVRQAAASPKYGAPYAGPSAAAAAAAAAATSAVPLSSIATGRCARSVHCSKAAGHAGFCSGPKAAAAKACRRPEAALSESAASESPPGAEGEYSSDETAATTVALHPPSSLLSHLPPHLHLHPLAHLPAGLRLAKRLTPYDVASRRAILPAGDVDEGVPNAGAADLLSLAAVDEGQGWQFLTLRAWRSVTGRRGYALEDAHGFLEARGACAGDELVVYRHADLAPPRIEVRAGGDAKRLRHPPRPDAELSFAQLPLLLLPPESAGQRAAAAAAAGGAVMVCHRVAGCTKPAGHQGFCSGHKGFKRKDGSSGTPTSRHHRMAGARHAAASAYFGAGGREQYEEQYAEEWGSDEEYLAPAKRPRRSAATTPRASQAGSPHSSSDPLLSLLSLLGS